MADQRAALLDDGLDAALVRLPIDPDGLHVIPLYDEVAVVVASADSHLTAADELDLADLAGEVVIVPQDDVLGLDVPGAVAASFAPPEDTEQAIATVAAGVGVVIVPMSLARLHRRKDAAYRPLRDGADLDGGAGVAGRSHDARGRGVRRHRARAHAELVPRLTARTTKVGGCRRPGSLRHPPRNRSGRSTRPDRAPRISCPQRPAPPDADLREPFHVPRAAQHPA